MIQEGKTVNATDFTKNKMHFTIALLATLFALHPFFPTFDQISFAYMGLDVPLSWAFMAIGVLLASAVYCYATDLTSEHPSPLGQRFGNYFYAMALMTVPFYGGMWATTLLEDYLIRQDVFETIHVQTPVITIGILVVWLIIWQVGGFWIRKYLAKKDWTSRIEQLTDREMDALKRAKELMEAEHADLAIIQFHKAVLARLKMATMKRGYFESHRVFVNAKKCGVINEKTEPLLEVIRNNNAIACSTTPVGMKAAVETADAVRSLLATVSV
jgi:hypothetical protein